MTATLNLMLAHNEQPCTKLDIYRAPAPVSLGPKHFPIPHGTLVDMFQDGLVAAGLTIVQEMHALVKDGQRYFGLFEVRNGSEHDDYSTVMALRNSLDMAFAASGAAGMGVAICSNLSLWGQVKMNRKNTRNALRDLPGCIARLVAQLGEQRRTQDQRVGHYKLTQLDDVQAHDTVIRMLDAGAIPSTKVPKVLSEWREPSHPDFEPRTAWSLFNATTEALKGGSLATLGARTPKLHGVMDVATGLVATAQPTVIDAEFTERFDA